MTFPGTKIIEEVESPINGKLSVVRDIFFGTYIKGGGLPQSGGLALRIWKKPLKRVKKLKPVVKKCLILGLGGGGTVSLIKNLWSNIVITGVEIDPIIVELGKKYLGFNRADADIKIIDANKFLKKEIIDGKKYDLVLVDMYVKDQVPKKFDTIGFANKVKSLLTENGIAVFNRLYGGRRQKTNEFSEKLQKVYAEIIPVYPEANVMFICLNRWK